MQRGEIWWLALPDPIGSEPGYERPALIVQSDAFNRSRINTVLVSMMTTHVELAGIGGNVLVKGKGTGLTKPSVVNVSQLASVDRSFFRKRIGRLSDEQMEEVEAGLLLVLGLV